MSDPSSSVLRVLDHVSLLRDGKDLTVMPPGRFGLNPFRLPLVPKTLTDLLALLGEQFWREQGRCLAMLIWLDCSDGRWGMGIPRQRASRDSSCWQPAREDFPDATSTCVVVGSFQVRVLNDGEQITDACPPVDGLHFILQIRRQEHLIYSCVRIGDDVRLVPAMEIITDDADNLLQVAMSRVEITG